jgi:hypothetical protein
LSKHVAVHCATNKTLVCLCPSFGTMIIYIYMYVCVCVTNAGLTDYMNNAIKLIVSLRQKLEKLNVSLAVHHSTVCSESRCALIRGVGNDVHERLCRPEPV